jgi:hypothetical protein
MAADWPASEQGFGLRIVLDTNVALSALLWRGKPYRLLEAIRQLSDVHRLGQLRSAEHG